MCAPARILITGDNGFVGRWLSSALREKFPNAETFGLSTHGQHNDSVHRHFNIDVLDAERVKAAVRQAKPDLVFHLAAQASVARARADLADTWSTNLTGSLNLALAVAAGAPEATVLFTSTAEVYGATFLEGPVHENSPILPLNAYAKSKALAELALDKTLPAETRLIIARAFNHTGPGQSTDFVLPSFASQIADIERALMRPVMMVGNLDARRDFLDVRDVVDGYLALISNAERLPYRTVVNVASGYPWPLSQLLEKLRKLTDASFEIETDPSRARPVDLPSIYSKPKLLKAITNWAPKYSIDQTLCDLLNFFRKSRKKY